MNEVRYTKTVPVKYEVDVFVAGGGAAGVTAAIAAARGGATVFLAEATGCLGGLGTSGMVPQFATFGDGVRELCTGIGEEIRSAVTDMRADAYWTTIDTERLKRTYDRMLSEAGVQFTFFTTVCDVAVTGRHVAYVICTAKSGLFAVRASVYIDATGDGDLCAMGGGAFSIGDEDPEEGGAVMPGTLCSLWSGVDFSRVREPLNAHVEEAYQAGILSVADRHMPGIAGRENGVGGGNVGHIYDLSPLDEAGLTRAMIEGRRSMTELETYFRTYLAGYENARLCGTGSLPGVRESRRILCDYTLTVEDFLRRAHFEDEIGRYCYPVDIHIKSTDEEAYARFLAEYGSLRYDREKGESYGIPLRCLVAASFDNLLTAGRCVGTDRRMQSSLRVMPGCFITGQGAGAAAALTARSSTPSDIRAALYTPEGRRALQEALPRGEQGGATPSVSE